LPVGSGRIKVGLCTSIQLSVVAQRNAAIAESPLRSQSLPPMAFAMASSVSFATGTAALAGRSNTRAQRAARRIATVVPAPRPPAKQKTSRRAIHTPPPAQPSLVCYPNTTGAASCEWRIECAITHPTNPRRSPRSPPDRTHRSAAANRMQRARGGDTGHDPIPSSRQVRCLGLILLPLTSPSID